MGTSFVPSAGHDAVLAAAWFGCFGLAAAAAMYFVPAVDRGAGSVVLYLLLSALASAIGGGLLGRLVLDPRRTRSGLVAALLGLATVLLSFVIYAPLFALALALAQPDRVHGLAGVLAGVLAIGLVATWPVVVPAGLLAGWLLYRVRRR